MEQCNIIILSNLSKNNIFLTNENEVNSERSFDTRHIENYWVAIKKAYIYYGRNNIYEKLRLLDGYII